MVGQLAITVACGNYDRTVAIREQTVRVEGSEVNYLVLPAHEIFWRMLKYQEFDVAEMSLSSYLIARDRGFPELVGIPVFPSRIFRQGNVFIRDGGPITRPEDLRDKKVGVPEYEMTAALWVRGFLLHEYGLSPQDVSWWVSREEKYELNLQGIEINRIPAGKWLEEMLAEGEIDALVQTGLPRTFGKGVRRLFPDYKEVEQDYYRRTGIFPIMHTLVMRGDLYARAPWLTRSLYKAFSEAKDRCYVWPGKAASYSGCDAHLVRSNQPPVASPWSSAGNGWVHA